LKLVAMKIREADDQGAWNLFLPVMRMIWRVLGRLFQDPPVHHSGIVTVLPPCHINICTLLKSDWWG